VKKKSAEVTDEDISKTMDLLREQRAEFVDVTGRALQMGDFGVVKYSGVVDGKPVKEIAPNAGFPEEDKDFWLIMNHEAFAPGFCEQLVGANIGDRKQVLLDFPNDFLTAELRGRKATFFVEVKGIKEKKLPALDDAFAKNFQVDTLEEFKKRIGEDIARKKQGEVSGDVRNQLMEYLLRSTQFELPPNLVAEETRGVVYDMVRENMMRGVTKEAIDSKKDEIFGFANKSAADRVRASFILSRIAEEEKITVDKKEVETRIDEMAARYQMPVSKLREKLAEKGGEAEIEEQILRSKTLDFLEANAKVQPA
jgi:trigger factor